MYNEHEKLIYITLKPLGLSLETLLVPGRNTLNLSLDDTQALEKKIVFEFR